MGSGWRLYSIIRLHTLYNPLRGELTYPYPKSWLIRRLLLTLRILTTDVFLWCVFRALNPKDRNSERLDTKLREKENTLDMKGIEYPMSLKHRTKFEKQNPTISVTVFGYERNSVYPLRNSDCTDRDH